MAESLKDQWLNKGYINKTNRRGKYGESVYELNPYLEKEIKNIKSRIVNKDWIDGFENLSVEKLDGLNYFRNVNKIEKVSKKFRELLKRDYNELVINYILNNYKSALVLSGSLIETLLIYRLNKKGVSKITYQSKNGKTVNKKLFDAVLNDLLSYIERNEVLQSELIHLGSISRLYRNYVHPGKELKSKENLDKSKSDLCYISVSEIINKII